MPCVIKLPSCRHLQDPDGQCLAWHHSAQHYQCRTEVLRVSGTNLFLICPKPRLHVLSCWCLPAMLVQYAGTPLCKRRLTRSHLFPFLQISSHSRCPHGGRARVAEFFPGLQAASHIIARHRSVVLPVTCGLFSLSVTAHRGLCGPD